MNITIDLPVKDEQQKKELEQILFIIWKNILEQEDDIFLKIQEESLKDIWDDEDLDVYNKLWDTKNKI